MQPSEGRVCVNCDKPAMAKSKYCSSECGLEFARRQYHNTNNNGNNNNASSSNGGKKGASATEMADKEALDEISKKKVDIGVFVALRFNFLLSYPCTADKLSKLAKEQSDLEKAIQFARNVDSITSPSSRPTSPVAPNVQPPEHEDVKHVSCHYLFIIR